jgi:hypothetical protein
MGDDVEEGSDTPLEEGEEASAEQTDRLLKVPLLKIISDQEPKQKKEEPLGAGRFGLGRGGVNRVGGSWDIRVR